MVGQRLCTEADPYLIESSSDWNSLSYDVGVGTTYSGKFFKLTNDISVTSRLGSASSNGTYKTFNGTFDGDGHTLTLSYNVTDNNDCVAPFTCISGATIKNLHVTGSISTTGMRPASIASFVVGNSTITNCWSDVNISSSLNSDIDAGGLVARVNENQTVTIADCIFSGSITYSNSSGYEGGGMVGFTQDGATATLTNCYFAPTGISFAKSSDLKFYSFVGGKRDHVNLTNCYYNGIAAAESKLSTQGTNASGMDNATLLGNLGIGWKIDNNTIVPVMTPYTFTGDGTQGAPYIIASVDDWNHFATNVNIGNNYSGEHFRLADNITVTTMVGNHPSEDTYNTFNGTFDGDGHTIDVSYTTSADYCGPFCHTNGATIKNLITTGTINTSNKHAGGVVGLNGADRLTLENVKSSVTINTTTSGADSEGGLVGCTTSADIIGCAFIGSLLGESDGGWGGLIGWKSKAQGSSVNITNCLFAPASMSGNRDYSGTFVRYQDFVDVRNSYYTVKLNGENDPVDGKLRHSIIGGDGVSVECADSPTKYNVSGITAYSTINEGEVLYAGIKYDDVLYAGIGDVVNLNIWSTLGNDYVADGYPTSTAGILSGSTNPCTLTMPDEDVTVNATFTPGVWAGGGTKGDPYLIYDHYQLDWLATRVNVNQDGNGYTGKYFKLMEDINYNPAGLDDTEGNFTAIGNRVYNFGGHFDGGGHTISGIRIYKGGTDQADDYQGIFGYISSGSEVKNVTLTNARIAGNSYVGGIVGYNYNGTVSNCHVTSSVIIRAVVNDADFHGGIVGCNHGQVIPGHEFPTDPVATINNCSSAATLTIEGNLSGCYPFGAIVGYNESLTPDYAIVSNNVTIGATLPATGSNYGAVAGWNNCTLKSNYYTGCIMGGVSIANGVGCNGADISDNNGAVPALRDDADNDAAMALMTALPESVGTYSVSLSGRTLYKDGYWNTICLPFDLTDGDIDDNHYASTGGVDGKTFTGTPLEGALVMRLDISSSGNTGFDRTTGTLTLDFLEEVKIEAGSPYIVRWGTPEAPGGADIENPVFTDTRFIEGINPDQSGYKINDLVRFGGTFNPKNIYTPQNLFLYLGADNSLYYPTDENFKVNAFRAYFELLGDLVAGTPNSPVRAFVLNFGDESSSVIDIEHSPLTIDHEGWYTLDGRILTGKPSAKGIYINNGRKVVVK